MAISDALIVVAGVANVLAIGVGFLKAKKYVDDRVSAALSKDEVIQKISLLVKPDMIFDEDESIIVDRGASSFIKDRGISVSTGLSMGCRVPTEIRISFKNHIKAAPLLTPLSPDDIFIYPKRGTEHTWIYKLTYNSINSPDNDIPVKRTYRLEIM